jgi:tripartite-type tricarboxylate transporter receptor subunit TctC
MKPTSPVIAAALAVATVAIAPQATAENPWPNKPIRMTVSSGAGGGLDFVSRLVASPLTETLGQSVVVDNRAGASGSIAAEVTAHSAPDGYTFMMLSASLVVYGIVSKTPYDLYRDFDAVSQVAGGPYILTVHPSLPVKTVADLVAYAKAETQFCLDRQCVAGASRRRIVRPVDRDPGHARAVQRCGRRADRSAVRSGAVQFSLRRFDL